MVLKKSLESPRPTLGDFPALPTWVPKGIPKGVHHRTTRGYPGISPGRLLGSIGTPLGNAWIPGVPLGTPRYPGVPPRYPLGSPWVPLGIPWVPPWVSLGTTTYPLGTLGTMSHSQDPSVPPGYPLSCTWAPTGVSHRVSRGYPLGTPQVPLCTTRYPLGIPSVPRVRRVHNAGYTMGSVARACPNRACPSIDSRMTSRGPKLVEMRHGKVLCFPSL